jgi:hypothetical protein
MKEWNWISQRRNLSIENFLRGTNSIDEAVEKFLKLGIIPPERKILEGFFNENTSKETLQTKKNKAPKVIENSNQTPLTKYDDLVIIETEKS